MGQTEYPDAPLDARVALNTIKDLDQQWMKGLYTKHVDQTATITTHAGLRLPFDLVPSNQEDIASTLDWKRDGKVSMVHKAGRKFILSSDVDLPFATVLSRYPWPQLHVVVAA
jgi:hypothetical protein